MVRIFLMPVFASWVLATMLCVPASAQSSPDKTTDKAATVPVCVYSSKTYSDGAYVCVQKSLMLKCGIDGTKATWAVVGEKELSDRCQAPVARGTVYQQRARWYRRNIRREITPATDTSPKCFNFNGKRYCE